MDIQARLFCLDTRIEVLLNPPPGSPLGQRLQRYEREGRGLDVGWPWWTWKIRKPSSEEKAEVKRITNIQSYIIEWTAEQIITMNWNKTLSVLSAQREILEKHIGRRWKDETRRFQRAFVTMDSGEKIMELGTTIGKFGS